MPHRVQQVESTLQRAISDVLARRLSDPRVAGLVSVTKVTVSPDLHDAYVYVSVLPQRYEKRSIAGLRHAARHIHAQVCRAVAMRTVPHLDFRLDQSLKKQAVVYAAIRRGMEKEAVPSGDGAVPPQDPTPATDAAAPPEEREP